MRLIFCLLLVILLLFLNQNSIIEKFNASYQTFQSFIPINGYKYPLYPLINPLKDFYMHHNLAAKSDIYSIGLIILRICTFNENILKRETDESTVEIHIVDDIVNGPRIVQSATSRSTQINIVDAFNILLQGLLWHNPINRFYSYLFFLNHRCKRNISIRHPCVLV